MKIQHFYFGIKPNDRIYKIISTTFYRFSYTQIDMQIFLSLCIPCRCLSIILNRSRVFINMCVCMCVRVRIIIWYESAQPAKCASSSSNRSKREADKIHSKEICSVTERERKTYTNECAHEKTPFIFTTKWKTHDTKKRNREKEKKKDRTTEKNRL